MTIFDCKSLYTENHYLEPLINSINGTKWNNNIDYNENNNDPFYNVHTIKTFQNWLGCCGFTEIYLGCFTLPYGDEICKPKLISHLKFKNIYLANIIGLTMFILYLLIITTFCLTTTLNKSNTQKKILKNKYNLINNNNTIN